MLKVLDLFSGIGGFSLGLERTGGFEAMAFCEIEEFPRNVLKKHWPNVLCYEDVTKLTGNILERDGISVDVITGGFPCQDISIAGNQKGMGNETRSGLWSEYYRLIGVLRPKYAIIENVTNLLAGPNKSGRWFARILSDLAAIGYDAEWQSIPATAVGAHHSRPRVWVIAYPNEAQLKRGGIPKRIFTKHTIPSFKSRGKDKPGVVRTLNGLPNQMDRVGALGNAIIPQIATLLGHAILEAEKMRPPLKAKRDANEKQIFAIIRAHGIQLYPIDTPCDAICGFRGKTYLIEVKNGPTATLTPAQVKFLDIWTGHHVILDSDDSAICWAQSIRKET